MSLDDTGRSVWEMKSPPLSMLVAGRATEMLALDLDAESREPFLALSRALEAWWPKRTRAPEDIYNNEFAACLEAAHEGGKKMEPCLEGANVQMAGLLRAAPNSLPADGFYDLREGDFVKLLRSAAKRRKLPVAQLEARLKLLLENYRDWWPDILARSNRILWGNAAPWGKLDKRVREMASLADLGATWSWQEVGGRRALRLELDDRKRIAMLSPEELDALTAVIPAIKPPE